MKSRFADKLHVMQVFEEFSLSPFALVAVKKWVKEMADPVKGPSLARVRSSVASLCIRVHYI